ncbi:MULTISPECIES: glutamine synthetase [Pseudomonas putida group]|uniref:glutamine synthetase n=1 Tax=Pseudomonas putida group TaxID=136845 RepID=UPI0018AA9A89|nr:glutamine synthetase [Pseudomonas monteilii]MBF8744434.1 glutamine synthetase [Pseudomonas monteilii]
MKTKLPIALLVLMLGCPLQALAIAPANGLALCTRSATLLACQGANGSYYSVRTEGSHFYLRGFDSETRRLWSQTNSRYGSFTLFTGLASDGEAWFGYSRRIGWTALNRVSSSSGQRFNLHCSLVGGCR